ncbi:MAG: hypothetical protein IPK19_10805 [Chloroflexi bacterium]|nr:hypothetical protein [Chloroflexota bacterium]
MQRDSLAAIGQSLRQDFDATFHDELPTLRDLVQDVERLSAVLVGDVESFVAWITSATLQVEEVSEPTQSVDGDRIARLQADPFAPPASRPPRPVLSPQPDSEQSLPRLSDTEITHSGERFSSGPSSTPGASSRAVSSGFQTLPSASRAPRPASPASSASPTSHAPLAATGELLADPLPRSIEPAAPSGFSTVKDLADLARRIAADARLAESPLSDTGSSERVVGPTEPSVPLPMGSPAEVDPLTLNRPPSEYAELNPGALAGEKAEGKLREELARLMGLRPIPSKSTPPGKAQAPQQADLLSPTNRQPIAWREEPDATPVRASPPAIALEGHTLEPAPTEVDMDAILEALAKTLREDYRRYYGV